METDEHVYERVKEARRGVFKLLYPLSWVLLVLGVIVGTIYFSYEYRKLADKKAVFTAMGYTDQLEEKRQFDDLRQDEREDLISLGHKQGQTEVRREAVKIGYGSWVVDETDLTPQFLWVDINNLSNVKELESQIRGLTAIRTEMGKRHLEAQKLLDERDAEIAQQTSLIEELQASIAPEPGARGFGEREREFPFTREDLKFAKRIGIDLESRIVSGIEPIVNRRGGDELLIRELREMVHSQFDGFETYKKAE